MIPPRRLVVILGPTASGKSELAIRLAEKFAGEILSCDSTQVYRHFDIGTGKVPFGQQRGIPHHLVDLVEPHEVFTAGEFRRRAAAALGDISSRNKLPIMTAGTGLYLRALLEGLAEMPERSEALRDRLREHLRDRGPEYLHRLLMKLDPETAARIAPRDAQKAIRAIEVCVLADERASKLIGRGRTGLQDYLITKIGLMPPRTALYARIDQRVQSMFDAGWLGEVKVLVGKGIPPSAKPFSFIGYSQLRDHLQGKLLLDAAIIQIRQATRRYAKRQITWFRREEEVQWFQSFGDDAAVSAEVSSIIKKALRR